MRTAPKSQAVLIKVLLARQANLPMRLLTALLIAALFHYYLKADWGWTWAAVYALLNIAEVWLTTPVLRRPGRAVRSRRLWTLHALTAVISAVFGAASMPLFASPLKFAPTLGSLLLGGALLNVIIVNCGLRSMTVAASLPHLLFFFLAPILARHANPHAPMADALWFGVLLMTMSVAMAARTLDNALRAEARAKEEAEQRRREAEDAMTAKSAFVAMIGHELRTPISAILAGASRLHVDAVDGQARAHAQLIGDAGGMMRTLLNDLLDFSRLEAGHMSVESSAFDLRQTVSDTLRLWRPDAVEKGLRLRVEGAAALPRWVAGDVLRLRQVLNNLLSNAIKFTERGAVTLSLRADDRGGTWRLAMTVADTGSGIPARLMGRLFMPFDQLHAGVVRRHGGSGLGLVISRELARLMGGDLTVESAEDEGARFTLTLLVEAAEAPGAAPVPAVIDGARVLVVDDHAVNRRAIELILEPFGVVPTLAESGERALELLRTELFDAVLMDVYMPGMDGRDATRALRLGPGPNRHTPVIAVTASSTAKDWEACREAGMTAYVAKPIDPAELYAALSLVLSAQAPRAVA